ncbi:MAG TPA: M28 family peptidase [Puia sp.]|nr:M28 family peptidase [Puia sp.]
MKHIALLGLLMSITFFVFAQQMDQIINASEVEKIEKILSADDMQGRKTFTAAIDKAADFIANEFKSAGLQTLNNSGSYFQKFSMVQTHLIAAKATLDDDGIPMNNIIAFTSKPDLSITQDSNYTKAFIKPGDNLRGEMGKYIQSNKNYLVLVDTSFAKQLRQFPLSRHSSFVSNNSIVFIITTLDPKNYEIVIKHEITESKLENVVGVLPGKSKKDEYVIFSAHYDHLGIGKPDIKGDSIYNGANDDASGCTAVMMLAKYFSQSNNNERTLLFTTFTAEEIGGYGSQYFSKQLDPAKVVAMFNIEMIGTESKWGTNSAYITGYEKTDMGKILEKNLQGSKFEFHPDPYTPQNLFYRSDNATLARQGVPAHTISTSKMEEFPNNEPNYHKQSDEIGTLDMKNMAEIIKAIAISSASIVDGKDTPTRVDEKALK